jgi:hypothetical protein
MRGVITHIERIAKDVRAAGDVPLVELGPEGVGPDRLGLTLADELWLSVAPLRSFVEASDA